ncbi:MAG: hypothetical protein FJW96_13880 [Actinobacteria bacterium]|nr:hypothetical protein [Actinomycetota bacterium]
MPGARDPEYVAARRALLDALEALTAHRDALILVGAQAIYLWTGEADLAVAPYTTDADLAIDPSALPPEPHLAEAMQGAGFAAGVQPGIWIAAGDVQVDLLVPESLGGGGRRGARLGPHGSQTARKARGLEAALVDNAHLTIEAFEDGDQRTFDLKVAGPAALLVAKLHKLGERSDVAPDRLQDKDALDVLRLLRATDTIELAEATRSLLADRRSADATEVALTYMVELFGTPDAPGSRMAAQAASPLEDEGTIAASVATLADDLRVELGV